MCANITTPNLKKFNNVSTTSMHLTFQHMHFNIVSSFLIGTCRHNTVHSAEFETIVDNL
jgi:hypothetical protein